jgi:apolipoprotein D and lipocalin family protein
MGASSRFDRTAFSGAWVVMATFERQAVERATMEIAETDAGVRLRAPALPRIEGDYRISSPGVLRPARIGADALVVMWVDADFETAAIGTASGSFGAILDRDGILPPDRRAAAQEILAFYGWNTGMLKETVQ